MSDDDDVAVPRKRKAKRRALRVPVDDVPRRSAVSELPPATAAAEAAAETALEPPREAVAPKKPPSSMPPPRSSYPPPPPDGKVIMRDSVRVSSNSAADEADMLDPFAEMPDADVDPNPLPSEATQVQADDDLETLATDDDPPAEATDAPASVEVSIDELDDAEAEAIEATAAAAAAAAAASPSSPPPPAPPSSPPPPPEEMAATDTVPGVSLEELGPIVDEVGVVD